MRREPFTMKQVDRAIAHLRDTVAESYRPTRTYTELFAVAGVELPRDLYLGGESRVITAFMKAVHDRCQEQGLPPYDSLVVNMKGDRIGKPSSGYFKVNGWPDPFSGSGDVEGVGESAERWKREQRIAWGLEHG